MMKRTIKKQVWLSRAEAQELQKKAKKCCITESELLRLLIKSFEPKEQPSEEFYEAMNEMTDFNNKLSLFTSKIGADNSALFEFLKKEVERWHKFQADIERRFLRPDRSNMKWQ